MQFNNSQLRRQDRLLDEKRAFQLLKEGTYGILSMQDENGEGAYGIPVNYVWDHGNSIYIHCAPVGRKLRCMDACNKVSFCVVGHTEVRPDQFTTAYESVVLRCSAYRTLHEAERMSALSLLIARYCPGHKIAGMGYAEKNFPLSPLMPKFLFLNALATAKTQNPQAFGDALRDMINRFPDSDVSAMAKDMLALMNQGLESQTGESHGTLLTRRETELADTETNDGIDKEFTAENNMQHVVLILIPESTENLNKLLYNIALFNFSQFLIKDFDLTAIATFVDNTSALKITYMDSDKETQWYINMLRNNTEINLLLHELEAKTIGIGEENLNLVTSGLKTLDEYELWKASGAGQNPETEH